MKKIEFICILAGLLAACGQGEGPKNGSPLTSGSVTQTTTIVGPNPVSPPPQMGTVNGGGGAGIQCGDHVEMLDVFEARKAGLTLLPSPTHEKDAIRLASERFANHFWNVETIPMESYIEMLSKVLVTPIFRGEPIFNAETNKNENVEFVDQLPLSNDFGKIEVPDGCQLVQIAYFSDSETRLSVVKSLRDKMDYLSQGVLAAHEGIYLTDRRDSIENLKAKDSAHTSELTRGFVGRLFSTTPPPTKFDGVPSKGRLYRCQGQSEDKLKTYFYAFNDQKTGKLSLVFNEIYDHDFSYQMRADFTHLVLSNLTDDNSEAFKEKTNLKFTGLNKPSGFEIMVRKQKNLETLFEMSYLDQTQKMISGTKQKISCEKY